MKICRALILGLSAAALSAPAFAATNVSGNYTVTLTKAHPSNFKGQTACLTLVEDGSTGGWTNSGTFTLNFLANQGSFFIINRVITGWLPLDNGSFLVLSGYLPGGGITNTSIVEVINGQTALTGNFSETRGC
jgi:hypothetical protein